MEDTELVTWCEVVGWEVWVDVVVEDEAEGALEAVLVVEDDWVAARAVTHPCMYVWMLQ